MPDVLSMLLGAGLLSSGVLASALADRIRGLRPTKPAREPREVAELPRAKRSAVPVQAPVAATVPTTNSSDIVDALVDNGYKKTQATKAVAACSPSEQATPELWMAAALRRCVIGGAA